MSTLFKMKFISLLFPANIVLYLHFRNHYIVVNTFIVFIYLRIVPIKNQQRYNTGVRKQSVTRSLTTVLSQSRSVMHERRATKQHPQTILQSTTDYSAGHKLFCCNGRDSAAVYLLPSRIRNDVV